MLRWQLFASNFTNYSLLRVDFNARRLLQTNVSLVRWIPCPSKPVLYICMLQDSLLFFSMKTDRWSNMTWCDCKQDTLKVLEPLCCTWVISWRHAGWHKSDRLSHPTSGVHLLTMIHVHLQTKLQPSHFPPPAAQRTVSRQLSFCSFSIPPHVVSSESSERFWRNLTCLRTSWLWDQFWIGHLAPNRRALCSSPAQPWQRQQEESATCLQYSKFISLLYRGSDLLEEKVGIDAASL